MAPRSRPYLKRACKGADDPSSDAEDVDQTEVLKATYRRGSCLDVRLSKRMKVGDEDNDGTQALQLQEFPQTSTGQSSSLRAISEELAKQTNGLSTLIRIASTATTPAPALKLVGPGRQVLTLA
jgi:hypothetical protein